MTEVINKEFKIILVVLVFLVAAAWLIYYFYPPAENNEAASGQNSDKEATLVLKYDSQKERWFQGEVTDGMSVFDAILVASEAGNFKVEDGPQNLAIDGLANGQKKWRCFLDDKLIEEDLAKVEIRSQDKVECRYE
jgi:hypothetical protein